MKKMSKHSRIIIAVSSLALISTYFLPVWYIYLTAPQYPEGLTMQIWLQNISGDVSIINGLNHYIGMKHINVSMFPEFNYLIYIIGFFILFGLITAITGNKKLLFTNLILLVATGVAAIYDFYSWGYDYGHNLDPTAPIQVPGLSYQPPVIGHKSLLNFDAYSYPDTGGWVVITLASVLFIISLYELRRSKIQLKNILRQKKSNLSVKAEAVAASVLALLFFSCSAKPEPIVLGKDDCSYCKMTIISPAFGGEIVTKKGKVFKFDDLHCMISFLKAKEVNQKDIMQLLAVNYTKQNEFIDVNKAVFIKGDNLHTPMNGNVAAFSDERSASIQNAHINGQIEYWKNIYTKID